MIEIFLPISIAILVLTIVISAIVLGIKMSKEKEKKSMPRLLWHAYLYIMTILSLTLFLYGGMRFTKAMLAKYITPYFSYQTFTYEPSNLIPGETKESVPIEEMYDPVKTGDQKLIEYEGKKYAYDYSVYKSDIVDGLTMFVSLFFLYLVHRVLVRRSDTEKDSFFKKVFNFLGLAQYGVMTLVALPLGIYNLIRYFTQELSMGSYNRPLPGPAIAMLLFVLPAWIIFLVRMAKENKVEKTS